MLAAGNRQGMSGVRGRPRPREREGPTKWEGWSRNLFRRNRAKHTLPVSVSRLLKKKGLIPYRNQPLMKYV